MEVVQRGTRELQEIIELACEGKPAWKIILASVAATIAFSWIRNFLNENESVTTRAKLTFFRLARKIPYVKKRISKDVGKVAESIQHEMNLSINNEKYIKELPEKGWSTQKVLDEATKYSKYGKADWKKGFVSGAVYSGEEELTKLMTSVYGLSLWTNPLHTDVFPGIRKMEAEVLRMCCNLFNGGPNSCGTMTTGGTESIFLACKAFRNYAQKVKGIEKPEILVPVTAHAAFDKAAHLLNMHIKHAPVDPVTMKVDLKAMEKMITRRTCLLVGSAPQFPHGTMDPIAKLGQLGTKYDIPVHMDACLGGFLIVFMEDAGFPLPLFDFRIEGLCSISCDTHKYGFTPKGSSVVLYRDPKFRHHQFFVQPNWPGGIYATPTLSGSRPGGILAASWASLMYHGRDGYVSATKAIVETAKKIERGCREIPGVYVVGKPEVSVVAIASKIFNIYDLADSMTAKGWNLSPLQYPSGLHISVTIPHTKPGVAERLLADIKSFAEELVKNPPKELGSSAAMYGMAQTLPDRTILDDVTSAYFDACFNTDDPQPQPPAKTQ